MRKDRFAMESEMYKETSNNSNVESVREKEDLAVKAAKGERGSHESVKSSASGVTEDKNSRLENDPFETEETVKIIPPATGENQQRRKRRNKRKDFNPWGELEKASKKNVTRRDLITGLFRFLPREEDKK